MPKMIRILLSCLLIIAAFVLYVIWENNRITVEKQVIYIEDLPDEFEGFTILQVTDLHEEVFGKDQKKLTDTINRMDYDAIVFTGDMLKQFGSDDYAPFYNLIDGIEKKEHALFVPGNTDPEVYQLSSDGSLTKGDFIEGMEEKGVSLLESIDTIQKGDSILTFANFEIAVMKPDTRMDYMGKIMPSYAMDPKFQEYQRNLIENASALDSMAKTDVLIALNHYPVVDKHIDFLSVNPKHILRDFDLLLAGHYHGGQIRIPIIGALFVPEAWYTNGGFFPPQNRVKGLWEYKGIQQYVSTGLGSSDAIPFLDFRLFNPPEINLLRLQSKP